MKIPLFPSRRPLPQSATLARTSEPDLPGTTAAMQPGSLWAVITGQDGSKYSWEQVNEGDTGTFDASLADGFAATGGTADDAAPAYEINGRTNVPIDGSVRVRIWPAADLTYYLFEYVGIFGASGMSHSIGLVPDPGSSAGSTKFLREDGTWDVPPSSSVSGSQNATDFTFNISANTTWQNTGQTLALPSAGTYLLYGRVSGEASATVANPANTMTLFISARLFDVTASAEVPASSCLVAVIPDTDVDPTVAGAAADQRTVPLGPTLYTTAGACTIRLEAYRSADNAMIATWNVSEIYSDHTAPEIGGTNIGYVKIA